MTELREPAPREEKIITGVMRITDTCWHFDTSEGEYELIGPGAAPLRKAGLSATIRIRARDDVSATCAGVAVAEVIEILALAQPAIPNRTADDTYRLEQPHRPEELDPRTEPREEVSPEETLGPDECIGPDRLGG